MPLTDTAIRNAKPGDKPQTLTDERGLSIQIQPNGGKWWRFRYRFAGKAKMLSLGTYPEVGLKDARERRDEARKLLANGVDPSEQRKAQKSANVERAANSFEAIAREWFEKHRQGWASVTHLEDQRRGRQQRLPDQERADQQVPYDCRRREHRQQRDGSSVQLRH